MFLWACCVVEGDAAKRPMVPDHDAPVKEKPPEIVDSWSTKEYFSYAAELMKTSNPPDADAEMLHALAALGINHGQSLRWETLSYYQRGQLKFGKSVGKSAILLAQARIATRVNGWQGLPNSIGDYGTDYDVRAAVAGLGLGANKAADACYRVHNLRRGPRYKVRLEASQLPPVKGFWSLTAYTHEGYLVPNTISRYNRGSESGLFKAADGSVTIYLQEESPVIENERQNWLPTPADGSWFIITARFYYPEEAILNGTWVLPAVSHDSTVWV